MATQIQPQQHSDCSGSSPGPLGSHAIWLGTGIGLGVGYWTRETTRDAIRAPMDWDGSQSVGALG